MPLRNVATNYTFEQQRQEINLLAADVDTLDTNKTTTARSAISVTDAGGEGSLAYDSGTGVITYTGPAALPQSLGTGDSPTFNNLTLTGYLAGPATLTIDPAAVGDNTGTVVIAGNLQVDGTTTTINSTTMTVDDLNITLASGAANAAAANGAGLTVDGASATLLYNGTTDEWEFNKSLRLSGNLFCTNVEPSNNIQIADAKKIIIGNDADLEIEHTGSGSFIRTSTTSVGDLAIEARGSDHDLYLTAADDVYIRPQGGENGINIIGDGAVELYHDNSLKLETTSSGLAIHEDTDKVIRFTGSIGEVGNVTGFQASNTAGSALTDLGMRATTIRFATGNSERLRIQNTGGVTFFGGPLEEKVDKRSGDISDGGNIDVMNGNITRYTGTGTAGAQTINIRGNASNTYNSITSIDYAVSLTIIHRPNGNEYINGISIDGTLINDVQWAGGSAPTSAATSGLEALHLTIWKVAANSYSVMAILNEFG